jgi:hypothetical protein
VRIFSRELSGTEVQALAGSNPLLPILATPADQRSEEQIKTLHAHYLNNEDAKQKDLVKEQERLKAEEAELRKPLTTVMVMVIRNETHSCCLAAHITRQPNRKSSQAHRTCCRPCRTARRETGWDWRGGCSSRIIR